MEYQHERHTVHLVVDHLIWCPKRRRKVLVGPVRDRLQAIIAEVANEHDGDVIPLAVQPDHGHLVLRADPSTVPADISRLIQGRSAQDVRAAFPHLLKRPSRWTRSFLLSTAGTLSQGIIQRSLDRQSQT